MEPNHNTIPGHTEMLPPHPGGESLPEPEQTAATPELSNTPQAPPISTPTVSATDPGAVGAPVTSTAMPPAPIMTDAMIADDADLIEKEWVERAKAIVAQTKNDPYQQNKEISKVKAAYLKKRYNKDLKVDEE